MTDEFMVRLDGVAVGYGRHVVLKDITFRLRRGCFAGLLGANGSGKTTLLKTLLGILAPLTGRVEYASINGRAPVLGYVPQREALDPIFLLTSFEVVLMGVCVRIGPARLIDASEREWARQCLGATGAAEIEHHRFSELSGGQKQRVLIARALAVRPDFLLLDEPTTGLDNAAAQSINELLHRIHVEQRLTVLMVSHDLPTVRRNVEEVIWLHQGHVRQGRVEDLLTREKIEEALGLASR
jgi:ABC-type Mn2+/Zn2+ transport system ATPase subunit